MTGKYIKRKLNNARKWIKQRPYYIRRAWNRKRIKSRDFTIISNNCWAGRCYQYLEMPYLSPTVGLYFFAEDYIKFVSDLRYYLSLDLEFVSVEESRYCEVLRQRKQTNVPIGRLKDVEVVFLHYQSVEEAKEKWERRKLRVNYDNLFIKFSDMNLCSESCMKQFDELPFMNKFMLSCRKKKKYKCEIYWSKGIPNKEIMNDTSEFPGNINIRRILNVKKESYPYDGLITKKQINVET